MGGEFSCDDWGDVRINWELLGRAETVGRAGAGAGAISLLPTYLHTCRLDTTRGRLLGCRKRAHSPLGSRGASIPDSLAAYRIASTYPDDGHSHEHDKQNRCPRCNPEPHNHICMQVRFAVALLQKGVLNIE